MAMTGLNWPTLHENNLAINKALPTVSEITEAIHLTFLHFSVQML